MNKRFDNLKMHGATVGGGEYRGSLPGVKQPRREVDHSPPSCAEVKNDWCYTFCPSMFS
jgi:hypothetical protein